MDETETLGKFLKRERELKNVSLRELSKNTRVREQILKAIEEDRHDLLPPRTFVKGFLSAYAKYLGLDANEILLRYQQGSTAAPEPPPEIKTVIEIAPLSKGRWYTGAAILAAVVVVALAVFYLLNPKASGPPSESGKTPEKASPPQMTEALPPAPALPEGSFTTTPISPEGPSPSAASPASTPSFTPSPPPSFSAPPPAAVGITPAPAAPRPIGTIAPKPETGIPPAAAVTPQQKSAISLQLNAVEMTWLSVKVDAQSEREMTLRPGEKTNVEGTHQIYLLIGNAGGLELVQNGKSLDRFGKSGEVVALTFTGQGLEVKRFEKPAQ